MSLEMEFRNGVMSLEMVTMKYLLSKSK